MDFVFVIFVLIVLLYFGDGRKDVFKNKREIRLRKCGDVLENLADRTNSLEVKKTYEQIYICNNTVVFIIRIAKDVHNIRKNSLKNHIIREVFGEVYQHGKSNNLAQIHLRTSQ